MGEKHWVDDKHYREVSEDGTKSWLYEVNPNPFSPDDCIEIADHHGDKTEAYETSSDILDILFWDGKGKKK